MVHKTLLRDLVLYAIQQMPGGTKIVLQDLYARIKEFLSSGDLPNEPKHIIDICQAAKECSLRGDLPSEPRYKNDIRWAIRDAKDRGLIKHIGTPKSGAWQRISSHAAVLARTEPE